MRKFFFCFNLKCEVVFGALLLIVWYLLIYVFDYIQAQSNKYYDDFYSVVFLFFLTPFIAGTVLFLVYLILPDSPLTRKLTVWFYLLSLISAVLILIWNFVYFLAIYDYPEVYIYNLSFTLIDEKDRYTRESKTTFIMVQLLLSIVSIILAGLSYLTTQNWEQRHRH